RSTATSAATTKARRENGDADNYREILVADRLHYLPAESWKAEHHFGEEPAEVNSELCHHGRHRATQCMSPGHTDFAQSFGACCLDVIFAERVEHRGACVPRVGCCAHQRN